MPRIVWDELEERRFETGIDRGVLYKPQGTGVPWNGLTSVDIGSSKSVEPVHFDGIKVNDIVTQGDIEGVVRAFTYPDELLEFLGFLEEEAGVYFSEQPQQRFHLCYRTLIGNSNNLDDGYYKLHILYNVTAIPSPITYQTLSTDLNYNEFEWNITAIPEEMDSVRPTAYIVIDSRRMDPLMLADLEDILYGAGVLPPIMPTLKSLMAFIKKWNRITILDNGDGTWTAIDRNDDYITDNGDGTFQIDEANAVDIDGDSYQISSTEMNLEDLWPQ